MEPKHIDLSIVIVPYKCKDPLDVTLDAVYKSKTHYSYEVIIVDNDSRDGTLEMVRDKYLSNPEIAKKTTVIENTNEGFGKGNNRGMRIARGDYILLLNPDTKVAEDNFQVMMDFMKTHPDVGIGTCKLIKANGELDLACRRSEATPWVAFTRMYGFQKLFPNNKAFSSYNLLYKSIDEETEVGCCTGAYMMFPRKIWELTGGFDDDYFMYCEDNDLCFRVRQAGYKIWYYPKTMSYHYKGQSSKKVPVRMIHAFHDAMWIFYRKHYSKKYGPILSGLVWAGIRARMYQKLIGNHFREEKYVSK